MKNYVLRQIAMLSRWTFYGLIAQLICTGILLAGDGQAQTVKSVREHFIKIEFEDNSILEAFNKIEQKTGYNFAYEKSEISKRIKLNKKYDGEIAVSEVLLDISEVSNLKFKQVNKSIIVSEKVDKSSIEQNLEVIIQGITITGKVTDENGEGLPGVNVIVKGTAQGTVTDVEGNYKLEVTDGNVVMVFSSVGFIQEDVIVGNQTIIDIKLSADVTALDEIVVTALGLSREKKSIGYAVQELEGKQLTEAREPNLVNALSGKIAGVQVTNGNGSVGASSNILIRGSSPVLEFQVPR